MATHTTKQGDDAPTVSARGKAKSEVGPDTTEHTRTLETSVEPIAGRRKPADAGASSESETVDDRPKDASWIPEGTPIATTRSATSNRPQSSVSTTVTTVEDALRIEEIQRVRAFIKLGWAMSVLAAATVPIVGRVPVVSWAMVIAVTLGIVVSAAFLRWICTPERFSETKLVWYLGILAMVNTHLVVFYFGTYSASPTIIVIGIYFLARLESRANALVLLAVAMFCHIACAAVLIFDVMPDPAVWRPSRPLTISEMLVTEAVLQAMYVATFIAGRSARRSSVATIESLKRATGLASQREAMLAELRQDLNLALKVGGPGRYTDRVVGDYKLGTLIGRGGMGEVYDASHVDTGEPAAVKLLHRELLGAPKHVQRFLREVDATRDFESPHIIGILAASEPEDPVPFLVMEKLHGQTLSDRLRTEQTLELGEVVELARQLAEALDEARSRGIVHRDLKPQNIFEARARDGTKLWKVLDFGIASLVDRTGTLTQGAVIGTPAYMAPEQAQGLTVDPRADVYGMAAVLFRCLVGRPPFSAADMPSLLFKVVHDPVPSPSALADVPIALDAVFVRALAKQPESRFESAGDLATAFERAVRK